MADIIFWKANDVRGTSYSKAFEVADYEFDIRFSEFKIADPICKTIFWEPNDFRGTLYSKVSEIADCEFNIGFPYFELAGPIWWT